MSYERIRRLFFSIRARFTALYLLLLAFTLVIFCTVLFQVFVRNHQREFDAALFNHAVDVANSISIDFYGDFVFHSQALLSEEKIFPFALGRTFMQIVSPAGQVVGRTNNLEENHLPIFIEDWQNMFETGRTFHTLNPTDLKHIRMAQAGAQYRQITYLVRRGNRPFILQIAVPMTLLVQEMTSLLIFFMIGIPTTLFFAAIGGVYLANKSLQPVRELIAKAAQLNPSNLSERLPEPGSEDEIQRLTVTLNGMLGRIEKAFESHENFIADASHQLKTPLAILRGELDVFRAKSRTAAEMQNFLDSASEELSHMTRLLDDLLLLAKIEAGAGTLTVRDVRLDETLLETISRIDILAKRKNISIRFDLENQTPGEDEFVVKGDPDLLQSMFRNLLDNAIKYSQENSAVEVKMIHRPREILVQVRDFGEPISPELASRLFQRYERGDRSSGSSSGTGLGLTIARKIAEMHRSNVTFFQENATCKVFQIEIKKV